MNWADKPTITWNNMHDLLMETIDDANKQMRQLQRQVIMDVILRLMNDYNILLSDINEVAKMQTE